MWSGDTASPPPPLAVDAVEIAPVRTLCPVRAEETALMAAVGGACARLPMFQAAPVRTRYHRETSKNRLF